MTEPRWSYLVAATQRSGSTLLCRSLADTGVAGRAEEYFLCGPPDAFPPGWTFWEDGLFAQGHDNLDREGYLELVFELGTTTNGVFGAKLMWNNVPWVLDKLWQLPRFRGLDRAATLQALFPNLHVVHLVRRDRVRQAVSWARAAQEGVWVVSDTEPGCGSSRTPSRRRPPRSRRTTTTSSAAWRACSWRSRLADPAGHPFCLGLDGPGTYGPAQVDEWSAAGG